jgi:hypothetical protein
MRRCAPVVGRETLARYRTVAMARHMVEDELLADFFHFT